MSTSTATPANVTTWNLDPAHSSAEFKVRHMMISNVKGSFRGLKGVLTLDPANPAKSSVKATADVNTSDHRRRAARRAPEERRLFRRRKIPRNHLPVHLRQAR